MGDRRAEGEPLSETFEKLLDELGIQIEFNTEDDAIQDIQEVTRTSGDLGYDDDRLRDGAMSPSNVRRGWLQPVDAEETGPGVAQPRADSRASMSQLEFSKKAATIDRPASRATIRPTERSYNVAHSNNAPQIVMKGRWTAEEWTHDLRERMNARSLLTNHSQGSFVGQRSIGPVRPLTTTKAFPKSETRMSFSDQTEDLSRGQEQAGHRETFFVLTDREKLYAPSRTQLLRDAYIFQSYRIRIIARDAIEKWYHAALASKDYHEQRYRMASAHDSEVLLRQAFERWCLRLHKQKQADEIRRYFDQLDRRATRARDLYLLTKAFTHWSQCTRDEKLRTSLARQHVLSMKYFHAWKDFTIANQKKVRLQGLQKYFAVWRRCFLQIVTNDIKAELAEQRRLMKKAYWCWFWGFCEARAPEWQARRLKERSLLTWMRAYRKNQQRNQQVTLHIEVASKRFFTSLLSEKARNALQNQTVAVAYNRQKLISHALGAWVRTRRYSPLIEQVSNMMDWRIAGANFALFINKFRLEKQAASVKRLRIMRNAWTCWNDHLRWQTLGRRIEDRRLLEALYKWTIASRLSLIRRLSKQRLQKHHLLRVRDQWSQHQAQRNDALRVLEAQFTRRSLHLILSQWRLRSKELLQDQKIAMEFHAPKVRQHALQSMIQKLHGVQNLNRMANDAAFFFNAKRSIKRWHVAAVEARRQKRRSAYIVIRRKTKMGLASTMLDCWRSATAIAQSRTDDAILFDHNRLHRLAASMFSHWRTSYDSITDLHFEATSHYEEQLLLRHLRSWNRRTTYLTDLGRRALLNAHLQQQKLAFESLNKLRLRLIELKGPQATADNLRIRYQKRHFQNTLRHWQDRLANRLDKPATSRASFSARGRRTRLLGLGNDRFGAAARAEEWTELDHGEWIPQLDAESSATPLRGNIDTPSKRAARAGGAVIQYSTTPKGTPIQLRYRAQQNAAPGTTKRALFGRSATSTRNQGLGGFALPMDGSGSTTVVDKDE